ncbi:hypothetical protein HYW67_03135 [Candidatus Parcubacteria bacterium]|nr:hypothetical protein [Candidatus Parcubacteria bacterium]
MENAKEILAAQAMLEREVRRKLLEEVLPALTRMVETHDVRIRGMMASFDHRRVDDIIRMAFEDVRREIHELPVFKGWRG